MFTFQSTENYEASLFLSKKISNQPFAEKAIDKLSALLLYHTEFHSHTPTPRHFILKPESLNSYSSLSQLLL